MFPVLGRRHFMGGALASGLLGAARAGAVVMPPPHWSLIELEQEHGGRLGVYAWFADRPAIAWRADERFSFCSSFKLSLAALILKGAETGHWRLGEKLAFGPKDLLPHSPALEAHLSEGQLSLGELAEAAQKFSDNGATNLLLRRLGGPQKVTAFWRALGDRVSRLDDYETALNRVPPGTLRNTTSPRAMAGNVVALMNRRGVMGANSRGLLKQWMHDTDTGLKRLRAGLPVDWWAGDKTGTGLPDDVPGCYVDLLWAEPKGRGALAIAAFYRPEKPTPNGDSHAEAILANVAHTIVSQGK